MWRSPESSICRRYIVERLRNTGTVYRCRVSNRMLRGSYRKSKVNSLLFVLDQNTCAITSITKILLLSRRIDKKNKQISSTKDKTAFFGIDLRAKVVDWGYSAELFINKPLWTDIHFSSNRDAYIFQFITQRPRFYFSFLFFLEQSFRGYTAKSGEIFKRPDGHR